MRQHAGVFAANFSSNLLWQNCFAPKKSASCAEPRRVAAGILDVCQGGATTGLRETRLLRRMFSYARRPKGRALFAWGLSGTPSPTSIAQRDVGDAVPYEAPLRQMRIVGRPALRPPPFAGNAIVFARRGEAPRPADGYGEPSVGGDVGIAPPLFGAATRLADVNGKKQGRRRAACPVSLWCR